MEIKSGESRIVIPLGGIVIKLPKLRLISSARMIWFYTKRRHWKGLWREITGYAYWEDDTIKSYIFKGIFANWKEFSFWQNNRAAYLMPTYFSLGGLLNIQKRGVPLDYNSFEFWRKIYDATNGEANKDGHHFSNSENFCLVDGKLVMIDYSGHATQTVLQKYGDAIHRAYET